jgi:hypothetical protein
MIIYKVTNIKNNKVYVGKTIKSLEKRKIQHEKASIIKKDNAYFHNAIIKYGIENFKWEIIFECSDKLILNVMETMKIIVNHSHHTEGGYNLTWGGDGQSGYKHTEETRKKISNKLKGSNHPMYGKHLSKEVKENHRKSAVGKHHTEETKKKMSSSKKGCIPWNKGKNVGIGEENGFYGKHHTEEAKKKMSESHKGKSSGRLGKKHTEETKKKISEKQKGNTYRLGIKNKSIHKPKPVNENSGIKGWLL